MSESKHKPPKTIETISAKKIYDMNIEPPKYLIEDILAEESLIYVAGPSGAFKTGHALSMAIAGATGKDMMGHFKVLKCFKTLFLDEENGTRRTKAKLKRLVDSQGIDITKWDDDTIDFQIMKGFKIFGEWITALEEYIKEHPDTKLIVIDNIARCFIGSERDEKDVSRIHGMLKPLIEKYGVTIVIIHHARKKDNLKHNPASLEDISGSRDFGAQCDEAFLLEVYKKLDDKTKIFKFFQIKIKDGIEFSPFNFKVIGDHKVNDPLEVDWDGLIADNIENKKANSFARAEPEILKWITMNGKPKYNFLKEKKELKKVVKLGDTYLRECLDEMDKKKLIVWESGWFWLK